MEESIEDDEIFKRPKFEESVEDDEIFKRPKFEEDTDENVLNYSEYNDEHIFKGSGFHK